MLVSPQRAKRPWQGLVDKGSPEELPQHDPSCYLCPGNQRAGTTRNPAYDGVFVFTNDFPALVPTGGGEYGTCRVICYSPRHDLDLGLLESSDVRSVIDVWAEQYRELGADPRIGNIQIFENRGEMMGASSPHPHCQIWATEHVPMHVAREHERFSAAPRLLEEAVAEQPDQMIETDAHFVVLVPRWAVWPFETLVVPCRRVPSLLAMTEAERDGLASILRRLVQRYDRLFDTRFPYSMGIHQAPTDGRPHPEWHLHVHFYPPLLRSATVRKFMVGYELLAEPQRDLTPEEAAERLRNA